MDLRAGAATLRGGRWETVLGRLSYTAKGDITVLDYVVYKWGRNGGYTELAGTPN